MTLRSAYALPEICLRTTTIWLRIAYDLTRHCQRSMIGYISPTSAMITDEVATVPKYRNLIDNKHAIAAAYGHLKHQRRYKCVTGFMGVRNLIFCCSEIGDWEVWEGRNWASSNLTHTTKRKRCFTSVIGSAVVSLRSSRPIRAEHTHLISRLKFQY
uniref:SFRICE_013957 n=1 Tax=Spodoptera frugiperda TaxID=7108 RepID=A0A2H1WX29_SPOFR